MLILVKSNTKTDNKNMIGSKNRLVVMLLFCVLKIKLFTCQFKKITH